MLPTLIKRAFYDASEQHEPASQWLLHGRQSADISNTPVYCRRCYPGIPVLQDNNGDGNGDEVKRHPRPFGGYVLTIAGSRLMRPTNQFTQMEANLASSGAVDTRLGHDPMPDDTRLTGSWTRTRVARDI
jgi:hypothetical protein